MTSFSLSAEPLLSSTPPPPFSFREFMHDWKYAQKRAGSRKDMIIQRKELIHVFLMNARRHHCHPEVLTNTHAIIGLITQNEDEHDEFVYEICELNTIIAYCVEAQRISSSSPSPSEKEDGPWL
jgi:hypothetical protein